MLQGHNIPTTNHLLNMGSTELMQDHIEPILQLISLYKGSILLTRDPIEAS